MHLITVTYVRFSKTNLKVKQPVIQRRVVFVFQNFRSKKSLPICFTNNKFRVFVFQKKKHRPKMQVFKNFKGPLLLQNGHVKFFHYCLFSEAEMHFLKDLV